MKVTNKLMLAGATALMMMLAACGNGNNRSADSTVNEMDTAGLIQQDTANYYCMDEQKESEFRKLHQSSPDFSASRIIRIGRFLFLNFITGLRHTLNLAREPNPCNFN